MPEILRVTSIVHPMGDISADLAAAAEEEVSYIKIRPDACPTCRANADLEEPRPPKLHPNCHCELVTITVSEIIRMSV